jgi:hypothetical protein
MSVILIINNQEIAFYSKVENYTKSDFLVQNLMSKDSTFLEIDILNTNETIIFIMDMWDKHWCKEVNDKQGLLAHNINNKIVDLREKGFTIMHIPSDCEPYYSDFEQFKKVRNYYKGFTSRQVYNGGLVSQFKYGTFLSKILDNGGCNCYPVCKPEKSWTKQHENIKIDSNDLISVNPLDLYFFLKSKDFKNIIYMGVHANVCILERPSGIIKMMQQGYNCFLYQEYTDVMFNTTYINDMNK